MSNNTEMDTLSFKMEYTYKISGISREKTMADKLIYIPNVDTVPSFSDIVYKITLKKYLLLLVKIAPKRIQSKGFLRFWL